MRKLLLIVLLIAGIIVSKPFWEQRVSEYADLSFLDSIDQTVEEIQEVTGHVAGQLKLLYPGNETVFPEAAAKPALEPAADLISVHNVTLGMSKEEAQAEIGLPLRLMRNEYGTDWHSYHQDYQNYMLVSYDEKQRVNGLYTNQDIFTSTQGITMQSTRASVRETLGEPLTYLRKGNIQYILDTRQEYDMFKIEGTYVIVFYDLHENGTVTAIQVITEELENNRRSIYAESDEKLKEGFEFLLFELTNSSRIQRGIPLLKWDEKTRDTAREHSEDMAQNHYFSHTNQAGQSPFDRMAEDGITFYVAGENLAYGQYSSIFAHEGLMNSQGHRENILKPDFGYLGVGAAFNAENQPFFTANFFNR